MCDRNRLMLAVQNAKQLCTSAASVLPATAASCLRLTASRRDQTWQSQLSGSLRDLPTCTLTVQSSNSVGSLPALRHARAQHLLVNLSIKSTCSASSCGNTSSRAAERIWSAQPPLIISAGQVRNPQMTSLNNSACTITWELSLDSAERPQRISREMVALHTGLPRSDVLGCSIAPTVMQCTQAAADAALPMHLQDVPPQPQLAVQRPALRQQTLVGTWHCHRS